MNIDALGREAGEGLGRVEAEAAALAGQDADALKGVRFLEEHVIGWDLWEKIAVGLLLLAGVAAVVWGLTRPEKHLLEDITPAPMARQADGSVLAERAPNAAPPPAPHVIPKGFHEVRREQIVVAPAPAASSVEVDLSLVSDGTQQRVVASSPDGQVITALDVPIAPVVMAAPARPWAAGLSYDTRRALGIWVDRDVGRLVVGAALRHLPDGHVEAEIRAGVRF